MNEVHLELCASDGWAEIVERDIVPWVLDGIDAGGDVLEVGPGPGRTTDVLQRVFPRVTAVEVDDGLAGKLNARFAGTNVAVVEGDGARLPLRDARFSAAFSFTMLHHVPTADLQDRLLTEVARVLRPGAVLAGVDSRDSDDFRALHEGDTCVPIDPDTVGDRLTRAGFARVEVDGNEFATRFRAWTET